MAKIAFVQFEMRTRISVMQLSAMLKRRAHQTAVFTSYDKDMIKNIINYGPSLIGISSSTIEHFYGLDIAKRLKEAGCNAPIIMGGPHPTFYREDAIKAEGLDAICVGEGDDLIVEIADRMDARADYGDLNNLWLKKDGVVIKNDVRHLIEDLDRLPFPDRAIYYDHYPVLRNSPTATFILGRGCPYDCSYCFNHMLRQTYAGKGKFVRFPSADYAVAQIKDAKDRYGFKWVQLNDDTINSNRKWLEEFLVKYKKAVNTPFICNIRVEAMTEDLADLMVASGLERVNFGVESGSEHIRRTILHRNTPDEQLIKVGRMFRKRRVRVFTANMIGLPGETIENAFETININRKIAPELAGFDVLQPFPNTDIYNYCREHGMLKDGISVDSYFSPNCGGWVASKRTGSILRQDNIRELVNLHKFTALLVSHYWLKPLVKLLIKLKPNRFFNFISSLAQTKHKIKYASGFREKYILLRDIFLILIRG